MRFAKEFSYKIILGMCSLSFAGLLASHARPAVSIPLWPEGATPYLNETAAETGRPELFIYRAPEESANGAAVVVCPGGGYGGLAIDHEGHQIAQWLNGYGISAFVLHYRLGSGGYHFPTQLADVQRAIRTVRAGAGKYAVDPARIGVMGFSAGGHLASMAATKFDEKAYENSDEIDKAGARPDFAILCYAVIAMNEEFTHKGSRRNLLGPEKADDKEAAKHVASQLNVTADTPPTFLFHTSADTAVPSENAICFYQALMKHGVPCELHIYQDGPHGVGLFHGDPILSTWSGHLYDWMKTNGFLAADFERVTISGEVTLDGTPVSWGNVTFHPDDTNLPETTLRIRNGKFKASQENGPVAAKSALTFSASIWEATRLPGDGVVQTDRLSPADPKPLSLKVKAGLEPLRFDLRSK